jgi:hypothetical protein
VTLDPSNLSRMAVAGQGVFSMGPRNRRRLATSAITLGTVAVIAVLGLWFFGGLPFGRSANHTNSTTPAKRVITLIPEKYNLYAGMTKQQMLHRVGRPEKIAGQCWQYPENIKNFVGGTINAVRVCFWNNTYQYWFVEIDGKWRDASSGSNAEIAPPTAP